MEEDSDGNVGMSREEIARVSADYERIRNAVSNIVLSWSSVESELSVLLSCFTNDHLYSSIAGTILGSVSSIDVQITIVDRLLMGRIKDDRSFISTEHGIRHYSLEKEWRKIRGSLKSKKRMRNVAAHGAIATLSEPGKPNQVILRHALFLEKPAPPNGYSPSDLQHYIEEFQKVLQSLGAFTTVYIYRFAPNHWMRVERDTYEKRLLELLG